MLQTPHTGMFETVCLERIQQFDDPIIPDDEEVCALDCLSGRLFCVVMSCMVVYVL